jgi:hypothetical protein
MVDFSSTYRPPGVYVEEQQTPVVPQIGTTATVVALVGPSRGYRTYAETVTLTAVEAITLSKLGIDGSSVVVTSLDGATEYAVTDDYTVTVVEDDDEDTTTGDSLTIVRVADGDISSGTQVRVTYQYTDAAFFEPVLLSDFEDVKDIYGQPFNTETGEVISPLSMAAKLAFDNGARQIILVAVEGTDSVTRTALESGFAKISSLSQVGIVVPLPVALTGTTLAPGDVIVTAQSLATHLENATDDGFPRIGIYGVETDVSIDAADIATGITASRVMLAWPNRMSFYNGYANQVVELPGYYLAAAYAGRMASLPAQMPLTRKDIRGFVGIPSDILATMTATVKNAWSDAGVAVLELTRQRQLVVRHGTSTDRSSLLTREVSVTRAKDEMIRTIDDTLESARLVGTPILATTVFQVKGIVQGVLESLVQEGTIESYREVKGRLQPGDPQVIEVKFEYRPAYPLNYILVSFSIDTSSGDTEFNSTLGQLV